VLCVCGGGNADEAYSVSGRGEWFKVEYWTTGSGVGL
jgi:hypothetical protein